MVKWFAGRFGVMTPLRKLCHCYHRPLCLLLVQREVGCMTSQDVPSSSCVRCHVKRLVTCRQPSTRRLHRARQPRGPIDWPATGGERLQASSSRSLLPAQAKPVAVILDPGRLHFGIQSATIRIVLLPRFLPTVFHHCMILNPHRL